MAMGGSKYYRLFFVAYLFSFGCSESFLYNFVVSSFINCTLTRVVPLILNPSNVAALSDKSIILFCFAGYAPLSEAYLPTF